MSADSFDLEKLVADVKTAIAEPVTDQPGDPATTLRERFLELMVLILANLYGKTPMPVTLLDRATIQRITSGMDDGDAARLATRGEDWIRIEGMIKQQEGQKAYFLPKGTLAVLSTITSAGSVGEVMATLLKRYADGLPNPTLRKVTRTMGSYVLMRLAS